MTGIFVFVVFITLVSVFVAVYPEHQERMSATTLPLLCDAKRQHLHCIEAIESRPSTRQSRSAIEDHEQSIYLIDWRIRKITA